MTIDAYANTLIGCFDNLSFGLLVIIQCQDEAMKFIENSLHTCTFALM